MNNENAESLAPSTSFSDQSQGTGTVFGFRPRVHRDLTPPELKLYCAIFYSLTD